MLDDGLRDGLFTVAILYISCHYKGSTEVIMGASFQKSEPIF